jgi:hypothetical protein
MFFALPCEIFICKFTELRAVKVHFCLMFFSTFPVEFTCTGGVVLRDGMVQDMLLDVEVESMNLEQVSSIFSLLVMREFLFHFSEYDVQRSVCRTREG